MEQQSDSQSDQLQRLSLGWKELQDTVLTLNLAVAQIEMSMKDGDHSVTTLINSFTTLSGCTQVIDSVSAEIPDQSAEESDLRTIRETIQTNTDLVTEKVAAAINAFQFYDKLTQRLSHVSSSLSALAGIVSNQEHIASHEEWHRLREQIRDTYSMIDEASMFEAIMSGASIEEAIQIATQGKSRPADEEDNTGEVDLF